MSDTSADASIQQWVGSILAGLSEVRDVRVLLGVDDEIDGILVQLTTPGIADEVRERLTQGADAPYQIDPALIYFAFPATGDAPAAGLARIELRGVDVMLSGDHARVRVQLCREERRGVGIESGMISPTRLLHLVGEATLAALRELEVDVGGAVLDAVYVSELPLSRSRSAAIIATLSHAGRGGQQELIGSAIVRRSEADAAARATLNALNRLT